MLDQMKQIANVEFLTGNRLNMWWIYIVISNSLLLRVSGQCLSQTRPCQYGCHCADPSQCPNIVTGACGTLGCERGWDGPTCQRRNIVIDTGGNNWIGRKSVAGRLRQNWAVRAFDGDLSTSYLSEEEQDPFIWARLNTTVPIYIHSLRIYNRLDGNNGPKLMDKIIGFQVDVSNDSSFNNALICYQDSSSIALPIYGINCGRRLFGVYVRILIKKFTALSIREFEVHDCADYWFGTQCTKLCNCQNPAEVCDKITGSCRSGCSPGYTGAGCYTACPAGSYGFGCNGTCHCIRPRGCNNVNGSCVDGCAAGYEGPTCQKACWKGYFGRNCGFPCRCYNSATCDRFDGTCPNGCATGYRGAGCQTACWKGYFGRNCGFPCRCYNSATCDRFDGTCPNGCAAGYRGAGCQSGCSDGFYGRGCINRCVCLSGDEVCNKTSGVCISGCPPGYTGLPCHPCDDGSYGMACNGTCHCSRADHCDKVNGSCGEGCAPGYQGSSCQIDCPDRTFGLNCSETCHCSIPKFCRKTDGHCGSSGCAPGYKNSSNCQTACDNGYFGLDCNFTCKCSEVNETCHKETGACDGSGCLAGYTGIGCQDECDKGRFGEGCASSCHCANDEQCDRVSGNCPTDCSTGFTGVACQTRAQTVPASDSSLVGGVVGGVVGFLVIAGVGIAVIIFMRRRGAKERQAVSGTASPGEAAVLHPIPARNIAAEPGGDGVAYANVGNLVGPTTSVNAEDLSSYVNQKLQGKSFQEEFLKLPTGLLEPCEVAKMPRNIKKCRYKGMLPYDHTRVVLDVIGNDPSTDFFNANYIDGYLKKKAYIASQGTTGNNLNDFWRMVWKEQAGKIIMLTNLVEGDKMKVEQYWPDGPDGATYGAIKVETIDVQELSDCRIRTLRVQLESKVRTVKQFLYMEWPDHDIPHDTSGIIAFRERVNSTTMKLNGPDIIHCSAGVGRTGTYLAFDYLMDKLQREDEVDIFQCVSDLRHQRTQMVQTPDQYTFLHMLVSDAFICGGSTFTTDDFIPTSTTSDAFDQKIHDQFERLQKLVQLPDRIKSTTASSSSNLKKNRDTDYIATDACRVWLSTTVPERNDYINAVFVPVTKDGHRIIATQMPLKNTAVDLWRMLYERQCTTIVMLNSETEDTGIYWPTGTKPIHLGPYEISLLETTESGSFLFRKLSCVFTQMKDSSPLVVQQICLTSWMDASDVPPNTELILQLKESIKDYQRKIEPGPIVVHCRDGCHKTGLFCVALGILDRIQEEQLVSIMLVINRVRTACPKAIISLAQYRFCYDLVKAYLDSFNTYANFN